MGSGMQGLKRGFDSRVGEHRSSGSNCCTSHAGPTGERERRGVDDKVKDGKRPLESRV
jgi:hypothetical protein